MRLEFRLLGVPRFEGPGICRGSSELDARAVCARPRKNGAPLEAALISAQLLYFMSE